MGRTFRVAVMALIVALALAPVAVVVAACGAPGATATPPVQDAGVDGLSRALLDANGLRATGPTTANVVTIGHLGEQPWSLYLEVSKAANLDFSALAGAGAELRVTPIAGWASDGAAYVLVRSGTVIGAWIGPGGTTSGVLPITAKP